VRDAFKRLVTDAIIEGRFFAVGTAMQTAEGIARKHANSIQVDTTEGMKRKMVELVVKDIGLRAGFIAMEDLNLETIDTPYLLYSGAAYGRVEAIGKGYVVLGTLLSEEYTLCGPKIKK
jgi:hypothetical protein